MPYELNGQTIETDANGFLTNVEDWSEELAPIIAASEEVTDLTEKHWDLVNYLRDEYINNSANQPNMRNIVKAMQKKWGDKAVNAKSLYDLFPRNPDKEASKIGGLPDTKRKGGY
ncbi:MAG: TusE/DsrC/DsvC family sulfur relay protein [Thiotrichaceae bacterium]|nr:TusE/DsrC/DsvC family sulfur relay protein [Thiotrichaceae bacterium]